MRLKSDPAYRATLLPATNYQVSMSIHGLDSHIEQCAIERTATFKLSTENLSNLVEFVYVQRTSDGTFKEVQP